MTITAADFTARELQILGCLVTGINTCKDLTHHLGVSGSILDRYLRALREKTAAGNMVELALWAERSGLFKAAQ